MPQGKIVSIHWVDADGQPAQPVDEVEILADFGLKNDYRSGAGSKRQVTLVAEEMLNAIGTELGVTVAPGASRRQLMIKGLDLNAYVGQTLRIGGVTLEGSGLCQPCNRMNEMIGDGAQAALQDRGGLCCRAITGGTVRIGDQITTD
jgi:MOSC domain-containing protein YiiM